MVDSDQKYVDSVQKCIYSGNENVYFYIIL